MSTYIINGFLLSREEMKTTMTEKYRQLFENYKEYYSEPSLDSYFVDKKRGSFKHEGTKFIVRNIPYDQMKQIKGEKRDAVGHFLSSFVIGIVLIHDRKNVPIPLCLDLSSLDDANKLMTHEMYGPLVKNKKRKIWVVQAYDRSSI